MDLSNEIITVVRDCEAILIPSGDPIKLLEGTHVRITQALGGDYTLFVNGNLAKISGKDADAIGMKQEEVEKPAVKFKLGDSVEEESVWEQLRTVYDPEIPVDIYELGLIYEINTEINGDVKLVMTLTAPGCPVAGILPQQVADAAASVDGTGEIEVTLVWDPPWDMEKMSDDAKLALGMF